MSHTPNKGAQDQQVHSLPGIRTILGDLLAARPGAPQNNHAVQGYPPLAPHPPQLPQPVYAFEGIGHDLGDLLGVPPKSLQNSQLNQDVGVRHPQQPMFDTMEINDLFGYLIHMRLVSDAQVPVYRPSKRAMTAYMKKPHTGLHLIAARHGRHQRPVAWFVGALFIAHRFRAIIIRELMILRDAARVSKDMATEADVDSRIPVLRDEMKKLGLEILRVNHTINMHSQDRAVIHQQLHHVVAHWWYGTWDGHRRA